MMFDRFSGFDLEDIFRREEEKRKREEKRVAYEKDRITIS